MDGGSPVNMSMPFQLLTHEYDPFRGGIAVYAEETARALAARGAEVIVWAPAYGKGAGLGEEDGLRVRRIAMRGKQDLLSRGRMAAALRATFPERRIPGTVVLVEPGPIRMWMAADRWRLPHPDRLVVILHGSELERFAASRFQRRAFGRLLEAAGLAGVVSGAVGKRLAEVWPQAAERVRLLPGAPPARWNKGEDKEQASEGKILHILQVGRLHPRKGQDLLVEAVSRLSQMEKTHLRVSLVGPISRGRYAMRLRRRIARDGLPIELVGILGKEELRAAYHEADVVAFPSRRCGSSVEGLGLALLEGAIFGCAVIAGDTGGVREALSDGETGIVVPAGDVEALAAALRGFVHDRSRARKMGTAGRNFVARSFSWDRNAALLLGERQR